jgi:acetyl esterase/lipase
LCPIPKGIDFGSSETLGFPGEIAHRVSPQASSGTVFFVHGGGFVSCSSRTHRAITAGLARHGFTVVSVDYRLAPENRFPAAIEDVKRAYSAMIRASHVTNRLAVIADSAGAALALAMLIELRDQHLPLPSCVGLLSPWVDLAAQDEPQGRDCAFFYATNVDEFARAYLGPAKATDPRASPIMADLTGLPPFLVQIGEEELLLDGALRLETTLRSAGVHTSLKTYPKFHHCWYLLGGVSTRAAQAIAETARFLEAHMTKRNGDDLPTPAVGSAKVTSEPPDEKPFLLESFKAHNEFSRATFQALLGWYAFFVTINVLGGGWFVNGLAKGEPVSRYLLIPFAASFFIASVLAVLVTVHATRMFRNHHTESQTCLRLLAMEAPPSRLTNYLLTSTAPVPVDFYVPAMRYMAITFVCIGLCWIAGTAYAIQLEERIALEKGQPVYHPAWVKSVEGRLTKWGIW